MNRVYCNSNLIKEYINFYSSCGAKWERFWNILQLDFSPGYLVNNRNDIEKIYNFKLELQQERNVRYSKVG